MSPLKIPGEKPKISVTPESLDEYLPIIKAKLEVLGYEATISAVVENVLRDAGKIPAGHELDTHDFLPHIHHIKDKLNPEWRASGFWGGDHTK